jgi:hypothetical protein
VQITQAPAAEILILDLSIFRRNPFGSVSLVRCAGERGLLAFLRSRCLGAIDSAVGYFPN